MNNKRLSSDILLYKNFFKSRTAFSLIELLVALSILAVVSAIIVPKYVGIRSQAMLTSATATIKEMNNTYSQWQALGGYIKDPAQATNTCWIIGFLSNSSVNRGIGCTAYGDSAGAMGSTVIVLPAQVITATSVPQGIAYNGGTAQNGIDQWETICNFGGRYYKIRFDASRPDPFYLYLDTTTGSPKLFTY